MKTNTLIRFACEPWLIDPRAIAVLVNQALRPDALLFDVEHKTTLDKAQVLNDGTAILPITGVLLHGDDGLEAEWFGGSLYSEIIDAAGYMAADPAITGVVLRFDSPGGMAMGAAETADAIERLADVKPVVALAEGQMDSAAYWIGAAADAIVASRSSSVGSIGVYSVLTDLSRMADDMGIDVQVYRSGDLKGIGVPGAAVTEKQRTFLQQHVDRLGVEFRGEMKRHRPQLADEMMDGRDVLGADSVALGFADIVGGMDDAMAELSAWRSARSKTAHA